MHAFELVGMEGYLSLATTELDIPAPAAHEVLVKIRAAGVTPTELSWFPSTHRQDGSPREGAIPGHEFSGVIAAVDESVTGFRVGDEVFGMNDWFANGATAEYCTAPVEAVARRPSSLSHDEAATVPISSLTAWQGLVERAQIVAGERVLIHGAAGAVGLMAVQIASLMGCQVIASATADRFKLLDTLGAAECIDYRSTPFEKVAGEVDVVFDTVGGDMLERSKPLLRKGGRMITIAADAEGKKDPLIESAFFIVEPSAVQLSEIGSLIDAGQLRVFVKRCYAFSESPKAYLEQGSRWAPLARALYGRCNRPRLRFR